MKARAPANRIGATLLLLAALASPQDARSQDPAQTPIPDLSDIGPSAIKFLPDPPKGKVTVQLSARAVKAAIPGQFKFYLAAPEAGKVFTTVSVPKGERVPKGQELENGIAFVEPGKFYTVQVVYENPTNEDMRFVVVAPELDPQAALPYARALCMCAAIPFSAPAEGAWYRTIRVGVALNTPPGAKATVTWPVIRITESEGEQMKRTPIALAPLIAALPASTVDAEAQQRERYAVPQAYVVQRTADIPDPPPQKVALRLSVAYVPDPLPGDGLRFYEPDPEVSTLWAMQSLPKGEPLPVVRQIEGGVLFLEPGEKKTVTVAFRNPTSSEVSLMALPYDVSPAGGLPQTRLTCFCMAVTYRAPADGAWYRVIGVGVSADTRPGSKLDALFTIITNPEWFPMETPGAEIGIPEARAAHAKTSPLVEQGKVLAARNGCAACHSADGGPSPGPTWQALFGTARPLAGGGEVMADELYLRESILDPNSKIAQGYPPDMMPKNYAETLSGEESRALIEYIKSLANDTDR